MSHRTKTRFKLPYLVFVLVTFALMSAASAAPIPPPSDKISYEEYQALIRLKTSQVPELQKLWTWTNEKKINEIYLGGGILRGLLVWIHKGLAENGLESVRKSRVPSITELLIQKDADKDIFASDRYADGIKKWEPYKTWDVLNETFYRQSVANRGATVDRIRANNSKIEDPAGALPEIYKGKLTFDTSGLPFHQTHDKTILGDNWLGLTLRYLRFTQDMGQIADGDPVAAEEIRKLAKEKSNWIPVNVEHGDSWPKERTPEKMMAFRIRKALNKLYKSTKGSDVQFLRVLRNHNLLELLSSRNYNVTSYDLTRFSSMLASARKHNFPFEGAAKFARMQCLQVPACIKMHQELLFAAATPEEAMLALKPMRDTISDVYKKELGALYATEFARNPLLAKAQITHADQKRLGLLFNRVDLIILLKKAALRSTSDVSEKIRIVSYLYETPSDAYKKENQALAIKLAGEIGSQIKTASDLHKLEVIVNSIKSGLALKRAALANASTPQILLEMLQAPFANPNREYTDGIESLRTEMFSKFIEMKPDTSLIRSYYARMQSHKSLPGNAVEQLMEIHSKSLAAANNPDEAFKALEPIQSPMTNEYRAKLASMVADEFKTNQWLQKYNLDVSTMRDWEKRFSSVEVSLALKQAALRALTATPENWNQILEDVTSTNKESAAHKAVVELRIAKFTQFVDMNPRVDELKTYLTQTGTPLTDERLIKAAINNASDRSTMSRRIDLVLKMGETLSGTQKQELISALEPVLHEKGYSVQYFNQTRARLGLTMISVRETRWNNPHLSPSRMGQCEVLFAH